MRKRIVITNVYGDDNRGGAAITAATIDAVRRAFPNCQVSLITVTDRSAELRSTHRHTFRSFPDVELLPALVTVPSGPIAGLRALIRSIVLLCRARHSENPGVQRIRAADVVVGKGGQVFKPTRDCRSLAGFWLVLLPLVIAHRLRVRTALYSITVGPYPKHTPARTLAAWVLRRIDLILVRERPSYEQVLEFGVPSDRVLLVPDCVLSLPAPTAEAARAISERLGFADLVFGVVTVCSSRGAEDEQLLSCLAETLRRLLDRSIVQRVAVVLQTDGPKISDRAVSEALLARLQDPRVVLIYEDLAPAELMALYASAAFTLGKRVHSAIFSVVAATPAFAFSRTLNLKAEGIFEMLGLGDYVVRLGDAGATFQGASQLAEVIERVVALGSQARADVRMAVDNQAWAHARGLQALAELAP